MHDNANFSQKCSLKLHIPHYIKDQNHENRPLYSEATQDSMENNKTHKRQQIIVVVIT